MVEYYILDSDKAVVREGQCLQEFLHLQANSGEVLIEGKAPTYVCKVINSYREIRRKAYPSIEDQLDTIYHNGIDVWKAEIAEIKEAIPKDNTKYI